MFTRSPSHQMKPSFVQIFPKKEFIIFCGRSFIGTAVAPISSVTVYKLNTNNPKEDVV